MDNTSRVLPSRPELVPELKNEALHKNEEHTRRKRKRKRKKRKKTSNTTNEAINEEDVAMNEEDEPAAAQDSYPGLSSTQDLLGEPDFPSSQWPSFEMLEPVPSAAIDPIRSSPPVTSGRTASPPPWPKVESIIGIADTDADPTQQVKYATELSLSILEHAQKWKLGSYPVDLLSETFEAFGKCIFSLKHRLDCIDTIANSMSELLESSQTEQRPVHDQNFRNEVISKTRRIKMFTGDNAHLRN